MLNITEFDTYFRQFQVLSELQVSLEAFDSSISGLEGVVESWTPEHQELLAHALTPIVQPIGATGFDIIPSYESDHSLVASMEAIEEVKQQVAEKQHGLMSKMFGALRKAVGQFSNARAALARKHKELSRMGTKVVEVEGEVYTELLGPVTDDYNIFRYVEQVKRLVSLLTHPEVTKHRSQVRNTLINDYRTFVEDAGGKFHMIRYKDHRGFKGPYMIVYKDIISAIDKLEKVQFDQLLAREETNYQRLMQQASPEEQNVLMTEGSKQLKELREIYEQVYKILMSVSISSTVEPVDYYYHKEYNR